MENGKVNEIKKNKVQQMRENLCEAFLKKRRKIAANCIVC